MGSRKRRGPTDPGLKTASPLSIPRNGTCECPQTTTPAPSLRASLAASARSLGPKTPMWRRRIRQQRPRARPDVDRQHVGQSVRPGVDVAAHGEERGDLPQAVEHGEIADVARVQDGQRGQLGDERGGALVRGSVRVGHGDDPRRPARRQAELGPALHQRGGGYGCPAAHWLVAGSQ